MESKGKRTRTYTTASIILRATSYLEKDRLLVLFSRDHGKLSAIAKGARGPKSRLAAASQLFAHGQFHFAKGRSLDILTQASVHDSFPNIRKDISLTTACAQACELVMKTMADGQSDPRIFDDLLSYLTLADRGMDAVLFWCGFQSRMLNHLGQIPELSICVACGNPTDEISLLFSLERGGIMCTSCETNGKGLQIHQRTARALQQMADVEPFLVNHLSLSPQIQTEATNLLEQFIKRHLDIQLKSSRVLSQLHDS